MPARQSATKIASDPIRIIVRPLNLSLHEVEVEMAFPPEAVVHGAVAALPVWTPGSYLVRDYARFLDRVELKEPGGQVLPLGKIGKQQWRIPAMPAGCSVRYRLYCNELTVRTNHVDGSHAHLVGSASFLFLEGQQERCCELRFEGWPEEWRVATALPSADGVFRAKDHDELVDSPIEMGTFRLHEWKSGKATFEFAITGGHCGDENRILEGTKRIVDACGRLFGGFPFSRYVFLLTFSPKARGGLEHKESTSLLADPFSLEKPEGYYDLFTLIAHEFFHAWNVKRLRAAELGPFDYSRENTTKLLWFHEGFTSFIQFQLVTKAAVVPWSWVAKKLAAIWTDNTTRHGRHEQSLEESSFDAWIRFYKPTEFSTNSTVSYYEKGSMVAWMMDAEIRLASEGKQGIEAFFRLLWDTYGDGHVTDANLQDAYRSLTGLDPDVFWSKYISGVAELDADVIEKAYGLKLVRLAPWEALAPEDAQDAETVERARVYTGLSFAGETACILNVNPGSPAAKAGLTYNQEILGVNGWRTATAPDITKRLCDRKAGDTIEVCFTDRGRIKWCRLVLEENPHRITKVISQPKATAVQRQAFKDWIGQPLPVIAGRA